MNPVKAVCIKSAAIVVTLCGLLLTGSAQADQRDHSGAFAPLIIHSLLSHQQPIAQGRHHHAYQKHHQTRRSHYPQRYPTNHHYAPPKKQRQHSHSIGRYSENQHQPRPHRH